jgi:hypothetical protein
VAEELAAKNALSLADPSRATAVRISRAFVLADDLFLLERLWPWARASI